MNTRVKSPLYVLNTPDLRFNFVQGANIFTGMDIISDVKFVYVGYKLALHNSDLGFIAFKFAGPILLDIH